MVYKKQNHKLNDEGSAIVTVLIVVLFVSILATTVLYLAGRNVKMKATDRHTKESFYETEKTMEEIKAGLVRMASLSYEDAYKALLRNYSGYDADGRKIFIKQAFVDSFNERWTAPDPDMSTKDLATDASAVSSEGVLTDIDPLTGVLFVRGVEVKKTVNDYTTIIRTDFEIVCPEISFDVGTDTSVPDTDGGDTSYNIFDYVVYVNWEKR